MGKGFRKRGVCIPRQHLGGDVQNRSARLALEDDLSRQGRDEVRNHLTFWTAQ